MVRVRKNITKPMLQERVLILERSLKRLLASHMDYTESQKRGWPHNSAFGYPSYEDSMRFEEEARQTLRDSL